MFRRPTGTRLFYKVTPEWWSPNLEEDFMRISGQKKVRGIPNPLATVDDSLTTASAAEAEKTNQKLVVSLVEEAPKDQFGPAAEMTEVEKIAKGVQDVLAISKQGRHGQASKATWNRGGDIFQITSVITVTRWGICIDNAPTPNTVSKLQGCARTTRKRIHHQKREVPTNFWAQQGSPFLWEATGFGGVLYYKIRFPRIVWICLEYVLNRCLQHFFKPPSQMAGFAFRRMSPCVWRALASAGKGTSREKKTPHNTELHDEPHKNDDGHRQPSHNCRNTKTCDWAGNARLVVMPSHGNFKALLQYLLKPKSSITINTTRYSLVC